MMDENENELRRRFTELREADQNRAPGFAYTFGRAHALRSLRRPLRLRPLVITAAVVIAALSLAYGRSVSHSEAPTAIATWRAPTDVLLQTPGSELFGEMPALSRSILDEMIPLPSNRGT